MRPPAPLQVRDFGEAHALVAQQLGHTDTAFSEPLEPQGGGDDQVGWSVWIACQCGWESHAYMVLQPIQDGYGPADREWAKHVIDELQLREPPGKRVPEPWPFSR